MFSDGSNKLLIGLVFIFFFLIYVTSSSGHFDPWDGGSFFLVTESMVLKHSVTPPKDLPPMQFLSINLRGMDGLVPTRSLLAPMIAVPFYYAALIFSVSPLNTVALLTNSFIMSLICVVLLCFSLYLYKSKKIAFILTLIFGVCSFIWPYNNSLLSEPTTTLCIFASAFFIYMSTSKAVYENSVVVNGNKEVASNRTVITSIINKRKNITIYFAVFGALFLGLSVISHPHSVIMIPGFLAYYIFSVRRSDNRKTLLLSFFIALASILLLTGVINYMRFGSFITFGYWQPGQENEVLALHNGWHGLIGLLLSPGRGLIFYFPIAILLPFALTNTYAKNRGIFFLCMYTFVAHWLFFGTMYIPPTETQLPQENIWSGGWWGSRYLLIVLPFLTLMFGTILSQLKQNKRYLKISAIIILSIAGFSVNLLGILTWHLYVYMPEFNKGMSSEQMTWDPNHSFIVKSLELLRSNFASHIRPIFLGPKNPGLSAFGLAPCPYDNYIYCKFGIVPTLSLIGVIAIVAIVILRKIVHTKPPLHSLPIVK